MATPALVIGSGRCVWDDLHAAAGLGLSPVVVAVNDFIVYAPGTLAHAVSHHPDKLALWAELRRKVPRKGKTASQVEPFVTHSSNPGPGVQRVWRQYHADGSSSLMAVRIALALGHEPVLVCGVPLDVGGYVWADPREETPQDFRRYRKAWDKARVELEGRVRAPSGYLRDLLGWAAP